MPSNRSPTSTAPRGKLNDPSQGYVSGHLPADSRHQGGAAELGVLWHVCWFRFVVFFVKSWNVPVHMEFVTTLAQGGFLALASTPSAMGSCEGCLCNLSGRLIQYNLRQCSPTVFVVWLLFVGQRVQVRPEGHHRFPVDPPGPGELAQVHAASRPSCSATGCLPVSFHPKLWCWGA